MTPEQLKSLFRRVESSNYPELEPYAWEEIYGRGDRLAPGGLFLAARMTRSMQLNEGDLVLDLGCGKGGSSIFLAKHFGVQVVAVDLWIPATLLSKKFSERCYRQSIIPLRLDVTRGLPFAEDYFDAIFCMQAFHSFGGSVAFLRHLLSHLKAGGQLCVGGTCFNEEAPGGKLPTVYEQTDGWDTEYAKYHSPGWWQHLFLESGLVDVIQCKELEDGQILWEDEVLYGGEKTNWSETYLQKAKWLIDQLIYGHEHRPYLTHFVATVEKKEVSRHPREC